MDKSFQVSDIPTNPIKPFQNAAMHVERVDFVLVQRTVVR